MPPYFNLSIEGAKCTECLQGLLRCSLRCSECGEGAHLVCSGLPRVFLLRLATTRACFVCSTCIRAKAGEKMDEVLKEIDELMGRERELRESSQTSSDTLSVNGAEIPGNTPSAPSLSQMPATQLLCDDQQLDWTAESAAQQRSIEPLHPSQPLVGRSESVVQNSQLRGGAESGVAGQSFNSKLNFNGKPVEKGKRKEVCRYYKRGTCKHGKKGDDCMYAHPGKCFKYLKFGDDEHKGCKNRTCQYLHPPLCRLVESGRVCRRENCKFLHRKSALKNCKNLALDKIPRNRNRNYSEVVLSGGSHSVEVERHEPPSVKTERRGVFPRRTEVSAHPAGHSEHQQDFQLDFRVLQDQMARMERHLRHLLDVRDSERGANRCGIH